MFRSFAKDLNIASNFKQERSSFSIVRENASRLDLYAKENIACDNFTAIENAACQKLIVRENASRLDLYAKENIVCDNFTARENAA